MTAMEDLCANSSNCREITVKLCWPHLQEEAATAAEVVAVPFDVEQAASEINDYNAWCEQTQRTTTNGEVPMYQWPDIDENGLNFFYGAGFGRGF
jgi:mannosyl-oligosaccharide alpha-1,2-mannosidase